MLLMHTLDPPRANETPTLSKITTRLVAEGLRFRMDEMLLQAVAARMSNTRILFVWTIADAVRNGVIDHATHCP